MFQIYLFLNWIIGLYIFVIVANAIFSWLYAFGIINPYHPIARSIARFFYNVTEPLLQPIRNILPNLGAIDISPIVLIFALQILRSYVLPAIFF